MKAPKFLLFLFLLSSAKAHYSTRVNYRRDSLLQTEWTSEQKAAVERLLQKTLEGYILLRQKAYQKLLQEYKRLLEQQGYTGKALEIEAQSALVTQLDAQRMQVQVSALANSTCVRCGRTYLECERYIEFTKETQAHPTLPNIESYAQSVDRHLGIFLTYGVLAELGNAVADLSLLFDNQCNALLKIHPDLNLRDNKPAPVQFR